MHLSISMKNPVKAGLGSDEKPTVSTKRHDQAWREPCRFSFVANQKDPLAFLLTEAVSYLPTAALATVDTFICKLPAPTLERGQPNTEQQDPFTESHTVVHACVEELQGLTV